MSNNIDHIQKLIGKNKIGEAFDYLLAIATNNEDMMQQILTVQSKYNNVKRKECLGMLSPEEIFTVQAQINYAMLEILKQFKDKLVLPGIHALRRSVFISYSHKDAAIANRLRDKLIGAGIAVIIDSANLKPGEDISRFIEKSVLDTHATISIVSRKSILSAWVAMETIITCRSYQAGPKKIFIPCYIEDDFFNRKFTDEALEIIETELKEIEEIKQSRAAHGRDTRDVNNEYTRLKDLCNGIDEIIRRLRESYCVDIRGENLEINVPNIVELLLS